MFAGVGVGITGAGVLCMALICSGIDSARTWAVFGIVSLLLTAVVWIAFGDSPWHDIPSKSIPALPQHMTRSPDRLLLAGYYGAFDFGYIIPATFLPAMARRFVTDPAVFGWAWPVFGTAAALSTFAAARWLHAVYDRRVWAVASLLMAVGVVLPVVWPGLDAILIAALLVGGTFMVITMTGLREASARRRQRNRFHRRDDGGIRGGPSRWSARRQRRCWYPARFCRRADCCRHHPGARGSSVVAIGEESPEESVNYARGVRSVTEAGKVND